MLTARPVEGFVLAPEPSTLRFTTDSELNDRLGSVAETVLEQQGYPVRNSASLRIEIETDLEARRPARRVGLTAKAGDSSYGEVGV